MITQERLKELLHYCPETGVFTHIKPRKGIRVGEIAGTKSSLYVVLRIDGKLYKAHRLAFLYMTGSLPLRDVDHINQVRIDNGWINLRLVRTKDNNKNKTLHKSNTSGFNGVGWSKKENRWIAYIGVNGSLKMLGRFKQKTKAIAARKKADIKYGFHPNHGQSPSSVV